MRNYKFNFTSNLHLIASDDDLRPALQYIYFKDGYAYTTDAHLLLKQSLEHSSIVEPEFLEGKSLHRSIFQMIKSKFDKVFATPEGLKCIDGFGNKVLFDYSESPQPDFVKSMERVLPTGEPQPISEIGLNLDLLDRLKRSMVRGETRGFKLEFYGLSKSVLVHAIGVENQIGLIMPVKIS